MVSFIDKHFESLGIVFMALVIGIAVVAIRDEATVQDAISVQNGLVKLQESGKSEMISNRGAEVVGHLSGS